ncbi:hypothetical protein [Clostridium weizhouense]|uniref:Lipoprotein n=1 Tax=Clostridium weizhouense TaxID=2859781 RepID=A0ABS7ARM8_9CLOT|nr:hypothetical protein [Clostridium weizhouense]MBW6410145.1 hypothetical protein [Clostridium weizhouense]
MKKKIITLLLVGILSTTTLISCGGNKQNDNTNSTTEQTQINGEEKEPEAVPEPATPGDVETPTVEVKKVVTLSDLKEKDQKAINKLLGEPKNTEDNKSTYQKDNYTFEITYVDSKSAIIKITPIKTMRYPNDGINILNVLGINADTPDVTAPIGLVWNNKFNTFRITVASDAKVENKLSYVEIILDEKYAQ